MLPPNLESRIIRLDFLLHLHESTSITRAACQGDLNTQHTIHLSRMLTFGQLGIGCSVLSSLPRAEVPLKANPNSRHNQFFHLPVNNIPFFNLPVNNIRFFHLPVNNIRFFHLPYNNIRLFHPPYNNIRTVAIPILQSHTNWSYRNQFHRSSVATLLSSDLTDHSTRVRSSSPSQSLSHSNPAIAALVLVPAHLLCS
jgi:hypothetical protein